MNYPSIKEYIEAIRFAEDNFDQLKHLRPVLDEDGEPVMTSGNFAVVFQMKDEQTGKLHAVKCFLREQEGRAEAYRQIAEELEYVSSTFLTPIKYLDKELFVDTNAGDEKEFPVLLMDWVEGDTLDKYIRKHLDDQYELSLLAYQFSRLAMWLMPQPFAHGDLKPDNILVKNDGTLVLVDYDGMYVPAMKGQKARELGSPDFRHPSRTETDFDEHIDDFSLASILLSLKAISLQPSLLEEYGASDRLLFSAKDYRNLSESKVMDALKPLLQDGELDTVFNSFQKIANLFRFNKSSFDISEFVSELQRFRVCIPINHFVKKSTILDDYFIVEKHGKLGVYKQSENTLIIECKYDVIQYRGGNVVFLYKDNLCGVRSIDVSVSSYTGEIFEVNIPCKYLEIEFINEKENEYYSVKSSHESSSGTFDKYSIVTYNNENITDFGYPFSFSSHFQMIDYDHLLTTVDNKYGCISLRGHDYVSIPFKYDEIIKREDDLFDVRINNAWGIIELSGVEIIPIRYNNPIPSKICNAIVIDAISMKAGVLNSNGTEKIPCIYDHIVPLISEDFPEGELYAVGYGGYQGKDWHEFCGKIENANWQLVNKDNRVLVNYGRYDTFWLKEDYIICGRNGFFYKTTYYGKYDLYDKEGVLLIGGFTTFIYNKDNALFLLEFGKEFDVEYDTYYTEYTRHPLEMLTINDKSSCWLVLDKDLNSIIKKKDGSKYTFRKRFILEITCIEKEGKNIQYWNAPLELFSKKRPIIRDNHLIVGDSDNEYDIIINQYDDLD